MENYWNDIPIGKENAVTYSELCLKWGCKERQVRQILHNLSYADNGDNMILIRSSYSKGFYKTDDIEDIKRYKKECINMAKSTFAPLRKIRRVLREENSNGEQG